MEKSVAGNDFLLLMDNFSEESRKLYTSFLLSGQKFHTVILEDEGFLPEGAKTVYDYFLGDYKNAPDSFGRPRYFNQIPVPDYWEIKGNNTQAQVYDLYRERGRIFYTEPKNKRLVKVVDWLDERGVVRSSDHYNSCGALYARTVFNEKGQKVTKTYFSAEGQEKIVENYVTNDIILNDGDKVRIFNNKTDFAVYALKAAGLENQRIFFNTLSTSFFVSERLRNPDRNHVLFWQEPKREDIPGNMVGILEKRSGTGAIMVQNRAAYEKLLELGANPEVLHLHGYLYPFERENRHGREALICTNSDNIEQCRKVIEALPMLHFHIAALTEMSSRLMAMGEYDNVTLYPNVKMNFLDRLFERCDWYFDINHYGEIVSALRRAFLQNQLIFAFEETAHRREYTAPEHIYPAADSDRMLEDIRAILEDYHLMEKHLEMQRKEAMAEEQISLCR